MILEDAIILLEFCAIRLEREGSLGGVQAVNLGIEALKREKAARGPYPESCLLLAGETLEVKA